MLNKTLTLTAAALLAGATSTAVLAQEAEDADAVNGADAPAADAPAAADAPPADAPPAADALDAPLDAGMPTENGVIDFMAFIGMVRAGGAQDVDFDTLDEDTDFEIVRVSEIDMDQEANAQELDEVLNESEGEIAEMRAQAGEHPNLTTALQEEGFEANHLLAIISGDDRLMLIVEDRPEYYEVGPGQEDSQVD